MRTLVIATICIVIAGAAFAGDGDVCATASYLVSADFATERVAAAIADKHLNIAVVGTTSSMIGGPNGTNKAYPARLEEALNRRLHGVAINVAIFAKAKQTAAEAEKILERIAAEQKSDLVVWQTGTVDAMRGVDPDEFRSALDEGVNALHAAKIDIILMNMQYSPRTDSMIALGQYIDAMRFVALQHEIPLFDRFAVMKHWSELGVFDLYGATKKTDIAERVHDCIGQLLGDLIIATEKMTPAPTKDTN